ncbi:MAG: DUF6494 family protein [Arenicellales bacterium]|jgi:hypothetical protein
MNEDKFNMELRKFLKKLGITSQREIEAAVRDAVENGRLKGSESLPVKANVTIEAIGMDIVVDGDIRLE